MTDKLRRRKYALTRVLIESARILDPQFSDAVLHITGAQLEIMRNLLEYANRDTTFVSSYEDTYYLIPDASDWDSVRAIVADLENSLMGNDNVIWAYNDVYHENISETSVPAGIYLLLGSVVPSGEVWIVAGISGYFVSGSCDKLQVGFVGGDGSTFCGEVYNPVSGNIYTFDVDIRLGAGHRVFTRCHNMTLNDDSYGMFWGYKMKLPA